MSLLLSRSLLAIFCCFSAPAALLTTLTLTTADALVAIAPPPTLPRTCHYSRRAIIVASSSSSSSKTDDDLTIRTEISNCLAVLNRAAETKQEDSEAVYTALADLEKLSRQAAKVDTTYAERMLSNLNGSWRLVFTTGTANTQKKYGKINYFPLKAVQSFDTDKMTIENGIYVGDFCALKFAGTFEFDLMKRRLEFDFAVITLLQFLDVTLKQGQAAKLGAASGLGSESNVANAVKRDKSAFFNWISADATIATARGGGGGLALWKRVVVEEE